MDALFSHLPKFLDEIRMSDLSEFVSRNSGFLLTITGVLSACFGGCLAFILKSRCTEIKCCCMSFKRDVIDLSTVDPKQLNIMPDVSRQGIV